MSFELGCGFSKRHEHMYKMSSCKVSSLSTGAKALPATVNVQEEQEHTMYSCYLGPVTVKTRGGYMSNNVPTSANRSILVHVIDAVENNMNEGLRAGDNVENLCRVRPVLVDEQANREAYLLMLLCKRQLDMNEGSALSSDVAEAISKFQILHDPDGALMESSVRKLPSSSVDIKALKQTCLERLAPVDIFFGMTEFLRFLTVLYPKHTPLGGVTNTLVALSGVPNLDNAYYNQGVMVFGNGEKQFFPLVSLDVVGHEMAHGVVEDMYALEYSGHSGALNESFADVLGCLFEKHMYTVHPGLAGESDWLIGEDFDRKGGYMRNMENPTAAAQPQPDMVSGRYYVNPHSQFDYGGVHINSGIPNKIFTRIHQSLGFESAGRLLLQTYSKLSKKASFSSYAQALVSCTESHCPNSVTDVLDYLKEANIKYRTPDPVPSPYQFPQHPIPRFPFPNYPQNPNFPHQLPPFLPYPQFPQYPQMPNYQQFPQFPPSVPFPNRTHRYTYPNQELFTHHNIQ